MEKLDTLTILPSRREQTQGIPKRFNWLGSFSTIHELCNVNPNLK